MALCGADARAVNGGRLQRPASLRFSRGQPNCGLFANDPERGEEVGIAPGKSSVARVRVKVALRVGDYDGSIPGLQVAFVAAHLVGDVGVIERAGLMVAVFDPGVDDSLQSGNEIGAS
jgi:hypothetical protein